MSGLVLWLGLTLVATGCYTTRPAQMQQDVNVLREQIAQLQRTNADLTAEAAELKELRAGTEGNGATLEARIRDLESKMNEVQEILVDTRQRVEELAVDLQVTRDRAEREEPPRWAPSQPPGEAPPESGSSFTQEGRDVGGLGNMDGALAGGSGSPPVTSDEAYRAAYVEFARGNYDEAVRGFEEFLRLYPESKKADHAEYWIGEARFAQRDYESATAHFDRVVREYPEGDLVIPSLFKKGISLLELNRTAEGVVVLQHLIETHPTAEEAALARGRLQELGL